LSKANFAVELLAREQSTALLAAAKLFNWNYHRSMCLSKGCSELIAVRGWETMCTFLAILRLVALIPASALAAPSRACLTQNEAAKEYRGKLLKYRQVGSI
jgi:hypothetical protein